ncbi:MAG: hypothetical protein RMJ81_01295 [Candidatus Kryptonium sp.]|nr:hypothetical protein [Candidatus Kryptonium sp.]
MRKYNSNTKLIQLIFDELRETLKITLLIREMISRGEFTKLSEHLLKREQKLKEMFNLLENFEKVKNEIPDFQQIKFEVKSILNEILKIDRESADNIKEKMREISEELSRLIERRKILNYLR